MASYMSSCGIVARFFEDFSKHTNIISSFLDLLSLRKSRRTFKILNFRTFITQVLNVYSSIQKGQNSLHVFLVCIFIHLDLILTLI